MYKRYLQLKGIVNKKSLFLLGPRQTGKSTLLRQQFPDALFIDLLESETFRELSTFPETLRGRIKTGQNIIIVDEIQLLPELLNEVQLLIDRNKSLRFVLTGSSARKLKRGHANLLGGRALFLNLHPLVSWELDFERTLDRLNYGGLPSIIDSEHGNRDLNAYVGSYLREEIQAESLTRSISNFSRVIEFASHLNGKQINFTKIANDAQVPARTVRDYFQIFEDTLIGKSLEVFQETPTRKAVATAKFYLFDLGVARSLRRGGVIAERSEAFGDALEHMIYLELRAYLDYHFSDIRLNYWRSESKLEVDFVLDKQVAIEVKGAGRVSRGDVKGLLALAEDVKKIRKIVVCTEPTYREQDGVQIFPYQDFLKALWSREII